MKMDKQRDEKTGVWKSFYENGQLKSKENFVTGIEIGAQEFFYPSGQLHILKEFDKKGERNAIAKIYSEDGKLTDLNIREKGKITRRTRYNSVGEIIK